MTNPNPQDLNRRSLSPICRVCILGLDPIKDEEWFGLCEECLEALEKKEGKNEN